MTCFHCEERTTEKKSIRLADSENLICHNCCEELDIEYQEKIPLEEYGRSKEKTQGPRQGH